MSGAGFKRRGLRALRRLQGFLAHLFLAQLLVVKHPSKRKAVLTPRRAGKTEMACVWLLQTAMENPGQKLLYVALTRPNAKDIAWEMFKRLNKEFRLNAHFHDSYLEITLPNGAKILLRGADQENWIKRLEGQEFHLIVVDESGLYDISIRKLVYNSLAPMVDSCDGTICLIGRPGFIRAGLFWDITRPEQLEGEKVDGGWDVTDKAGGEEWTVFNWSTFDNPHVAKFWKAVIERKLRINPDIINDPGFRRNYLGEWAEDTEGLVYAFDPVRNVIDDYEIQPDDHFGMTTDFGWDDAQGFVVGCWSASRPTLIILESFKKRNMPLADALARMEMYRQRYPGLLMWGDPARKQLYMEMAIRFGEGSIVNPVEKAEKRDYIDLMNNDWALSAIKVVRGPNQQYIDEILGLRKLIKTTIIDAALNEERSGDWVEHPKLANDLCDCGLYLWRKSRHFRYQERPEGPQYGSIEWQEEQAREMWDQETQKRDKKAQREWWRRD